MLVISGVCSLQFDLSGTEESFSHFTVGKSVVRLWKKGSRVVRFKSINKSS